VLNSDKIFPMGTRQVKYWKHAPFSLETDACASANAQVTYRNAPPIIRRVLYDNAVTD